ncbi:MAG: hypothetical protein EXS05_17515 [Planctomycetaceae bacterium]|nr:hypothetical protein [Planctomycetaceae bacterium]
MIPNRRDFLRTTAGAGLLASFADWPGLRALGLLTAAEPDVTPDIVQLHPDIEPLVRLIEDTPREKCVEMMAGQLRQGVAYRQFLAALFLAGIRNVNPQPPGFKFHCVFVIHAAHQLSLDAPVGERLLPLFWALDEFKKSQAEDVQQGDFRLRPVTGNLPSPERAWSEFHEAMDAWDEPRADRAIAALVRSKGAHEVIEGLWRYGARDYRNIGHKAIFVANSWRTLQTIGWQHAEPVLRSLVLGLLDFKDQEVNSYTFTSQSYLPNVERAQQAIDKLPGDWSQTTSNAAVTRDLLGAIRGGDSQVACAAALSALASGSASAGAVWDATHLAAGELMMRQPGIYGIHTVTSVNALHYAFRTAARPANRLVLLLQGVGWMCQFRNLMAGKPQQLGEVQIADLAPAAISADRPTALDDLFATLTNDPAGAAPKALAYARQHPQPDDFARQARQLIFRKAADPHHYKYAAAIFEDYGLVSPEWRPSMLATSVYYLRGSGAADSPLMKQVAEAVRSA